MDITFTGLPDGIEEVTAREWMAVLIERFYNQQINEAPEVQAATNTANANINAFRAANSLSVKPTKIKGAI